jgi:hypothetical protein
MELFRRNLNFIVYPKARALGVTNFPYHEFNSKFMVTYRENAEGQWELWEFDINNCRLIYKDYTGHLQVNSDTNTIHV